MIGLYAQNQNTVSQLLLLSEGLPIEAYHPDHSYSHIICLDDCPSKNNAIILTKADLGVPLSGTEWRLLIQKISATSVHYRNDWFYFDASLRLITNLKTAKAISLTEKESDILSFLVQSKNHQCTKEMMLQSVWGYHPDVETHTLESHFYTLKQKLGQDISHLLQMKDGVLFLL